MNTMSVHNHNAKHSTYTRNNEELEENVSIEPTYGNWCEKSMSNDLTNMTDINSILLELYQNSESAEASTISFDLCNRQLLIIDNGNGMDYNNIKDYLSAKKDIYNRRDIGIEANTIHKHSFGGEGGKKAVSSLYKDTCLILTSPLHSSKLHIIIYDIHKPWGNTYKNPICHFNVNEDTIENISILPRMYKLITEKSSPIYDTLQTIRKNSGVIIYGTIREQFKKHFNGNDTNILVDIQKKCNDNLKKCTIRINNNSIKYQEEVIRDEDMEITDMKIWGKDNKDKYTITFTNKINKKNYYKKDKVKECIEFKPKKNVRCLGTFNRVDKLVYENIEKLHEKYLYQLKDTKYNILDACKEKNILLKRLGTILNTYIPKRSSNGGDIFYKNIDSSYKTHYEWEPNQVIDRLFGISADKLNPNIQTLKNRCTNASFEMLKNVSINKYITNQFKNKNILLHTTYTLFSNKYETYIGKIQHIVKKYLYYTRIKEMYNIREYREWYRIKQQKQYDSIQVAIDVSKQAEIYATTKSILVNDDEYMGTLYVQYTMGVISSIKTAMSQILHDMDSLQYTLIPQSTLFYYKLNTPLDTNGNLIVESDLLLEGEVGYTCNSIQRRHPNANIQFIQYLNGEGSTVQKGGKITVENTVIGGIKHLSYIAFGNNDKPNSKEIFRFPYKHIQEVRDTIENIAIRYKARGDIMLL